MLKQNFKSINLIKNYYNQLNPTRLIQSVKNEDHFYITTPIFYVNSKPHLGHLYTLVVSDAYFRFQKLLQNHKIYIFATGTDEHGLKVLEAAKNASMDCKEFCDTNANLFSELCDKFLISNTDFIRTTDDKHKEVVHRVWNELDKKGFIYKTKYDGWYSISDETFIPNKQIKKIDEYRNYLTNLCEQFNQKDNLSNETNECKVDKDEIKNPNELIKYLDLQLSKTDKSFTDLRVDAKSGNLLEHCEEFNYIFKLENVKDRLINLIKEDEEFIRPHQFQNILLNMIESDNLNNVSISRSKSRFNWGISVPNDDDQIIYVWFDALCNYLTVANYGSIYAKKSNHFNWPPSIQILGKDIIKFHAIYWPAFLFALDLKLPKKLHCHAHWMINDLKMSKSKGNVVNPFDYLDSFKADGIRYFLLKTGVPHTDGNFNEKKLKEYVNADIANTLGNLLQRSTNIKLNPRQHYPKLSKDYFQDELAKELIEKLGQLSDKVFLHYDNGNFHLGIQEVIAVLHDCNKYFFDKQPWKFIAINTESSWQTIDSSIYLAYETLRITSILLSPIIPKSSEIILNKLNIPLDERFWKNCKFGMYQNDEKRSISKQNLIVYPRV